MPALHALLDQQRSAILEIAGRHGAHNVRVFGSAVRGDDHHASDVDFLVEFDQRRSLLDQVGLKLDLEDLLDREVDVVTDKSLHPLMRKQVLAEARPL